jgi:hypothetical protein
MDSKMGKSPHNWFMYHSPMTNLAFDIYREFNVATSRAMTEALGMDRAVNALRHEWEHIASVIPLNIMKRMGPLEKGFIFAAFCLNWSNRLWGCDQRMDVTAYGIRSTVSPCWYSTGSRALCTAHLQFACKGMCESLAPEHVFISRSCLTDGDDHCEMLILAESSNVEELMNAPVIASILPPPLDEEESILWSHSYMGAGWMTMIKAMIEALGPETTLERLEPVFRRIGTELAPRIKTELNIRVDDLRSVAKGLDVLNSAFLEDGELSDEADQCIGRRITACPMSGEPREVCHLFLYFYDGLVKGLNPDFEFDYTQKMSEGGDHCHWVLRDKRRHAASGTNDLSANDPFALLSLRYVKGEISDDEYEKKMAMLKKHHPRG